MGELLEFMHNVFVHPLLGITRALYIGAQWVHDLTVPRSSDEPRMTGPARALPMQLSEPAPDRP